MLAELGWIRRSKSSSFMGYPSLTAVARAITGGGWNGPRFFGLREGSEGQVGTVVKGTTGKPKAMAGRASQPGAVAQ
jgi:hypothetical protein